MQTDPKVARGAVPQNLKSKAARLDTALLCVPLVVAYLREMEDLRESVGEGFEWSSGEPEMSEKLPVSLKRLCK